MASTELEDFIKNRLRAYDSNVDLSSGSSADREVVQAILRRIGPDPFTMDLQKFIGARLVQEFPDMTTVDGDAVMDLLVNPARLLMEPIVQEIRRVRENLSFKDPSTMTLDEADALGANFFSSRERGDFSRVVVRIYFTAPQNIRVTPSNYCFTSSGLQFLPIQIQSIYVDEMLYNKEGSYYYFDVSTVANEPGDAYNIEQGSIIGIYGVPAAIRATNKMRASGGLAEESVEEYVGKISEELTERSLVTERGVLAAIRKNFPAIQQVATVGFNDPEMQRDILTGEGIGPIVLSGYQGHAVGDGKGMGSTSRFAVNDSVDFTRTIGPVGSLVSGFTLTVVGAGVLASQEYVGDLSVQKVIDARTLEVSTSAFKGWYATAPLAYWMLRTNQLTVSGVPGGTELPEGEFTLESGVVHIGGMTDIYVRGAELDKGVLTLHAVTDDEPVLLGVSAVTHFIGNPAVPDGFILQDYVLGSVGYQINGTIWRVLDTAKDLDVVLHVLDGDVGAYRILQVIQVAGQSPVLITDPPPAGTPVGQRWRLVDNVNVDLVVPKETKQSGMDLMTVQGHALATIPSAGDLSAYGIGKGDYLELLSGPDIGIFGIAADTMTNQLVVDRPFTTSTVGVSYRIYRKMADESLLMPLVRVSSIDILDVSGEPIGGIVPYGKPIDIRSFDFTTPTRMPLVDLRDALVGCVGKRLDPAVDLPNLLGTSLTVEVDGGTRLVTFGALTTVAQLVDVINAGMPDCVATIVDESRVAFSPYRDLYSVAVVVVGGPLDAAPILFDATDGSTRFATNHIRSATISAYPAKWGSFSFDLDFDAIEVVSPAGALFASRPQSALGGRVLQVLENLPAAVGALVQVGPRSIGSARAFFVDPTTFEVGSETSFTALTQDGLQLRFKPDPTMQALIYPPAPSTARSKDGVTTNFQEVGTFIPRGKIESIGVDFLKKGIRAGDTLFVDFIPIVGDKAVADPQPGLNFKTIIAKMNGVERTIVLGNDVPSDLTAISVMGLEQQLNRVFGAGVARVNEQGFLEIEASYELKLIGGTALGYFFLAFDITYPTGASNLSANYYGGHAYTIYYVGTHELYVTEPFPWFVAATRQQYKIARPATQRVGTTQMALNKTYSGLYYADIQLVSMGTSSVYELGAGEKITASDYTCLGYTLTTDYPHLAFSVLEKPKLRMTPSIITVGASDDLENALRIVGQNLQINYEWSSLVADFQTFVSSPSERVTNANLLVRHLIPHYVRFDLTYRGSPTESAARAKVLEYLGSLSPDDQLESVKAQDIVLKLGATSVSTPLNLVALVYGEDRNIEAEQSSDFLNTGRLAAFLVDLVTVQKKTS